ncbi:unnamed protein product [Ilex paraguariensis]|uniref:F-box domain-containing protein n=1 Tax=Ilex paraguariensis TaxID=185542 RepID=A0ABC8TC66_9AQUA
MMGKSETMAREIVTGLQRIRYKGGNGPLLQYLPGDLMLDILSRLPRPTKVEVFTLSTNTWREVKAVVFRQITVPYADTPWLETYRRLVEYKESLAMFVYLESWFPGVTVRCEMWVMNDYGGGGTKEVSWIKELRVEHLSRVGRPLGWLNGDIVFGPWLGYGHNVFLYDPHTKQVKDISTHEGSGYFFPYKESLVLARGGINYRSCPVCCCRSG